MRICMTVLNSFTHDARVRREAAAVAAAGHEVLVLAVAGESLPRQDHVDGFAVLRVPLHTRSRPNALVLFATKYVEYFVRTLRAALNWKADVYHAHNANTLLVAATAARLMRSKLVYDAHEFEAGRDWSRSRVPAVFRQMWTVPEHVAIRTADVVITVSAAIADELAELYGIPRPRLVRNIPERCVPSRVIDLRSQLDLEEDTDLIIYQGNIARDRGLEEMIQAMAVIDNAALIVLGDGPRLQSLRQEMREQMLTDRVHFLGRVPLDQLAGYTASADVGIHVIQNSCPNHYLCLPNKLFEYIHAGLPVVVSDFPEMARIVRKYEVGELVDPSDPEEIAAAITRLLEDAHYRQRLHQNALKAAEHLNWEQESKRLLEIYEELGGRDDEPTIRRSS